VKRAAGYGVEFRSGAKVVWRGRTRAPRLQVSRARLPAGRYRWFVWRLNGRGKRKGRAVVDARITIR
jgi:hypothetical protein